MRGDPGARQKELGLVPATTDLPPLNPIGTPETRTGPGGEPFPALDYTRPWAELSAEERRLLARMAEAYAGFLSHCDDQVGRLIAYVEDIGQLDNTIFVVVSDNGASGEGGPNGSVNENKSAMPRDRGPCSRPAGRPTATMPTSVSSASVPAFGGSSPLWAPAYSRPSGPCLCRPRAGRPLVMLPGGARPAFSVCRLCDGQWRCLRWRAGHAEVSGSRRVHGAVVQQGRRGGLMDRKDAVRPDVPGRDHRSDAEIDRLADRLREAARDQDRFRDLLDAVMAVGRQLELPIVLRSVITAAMGLVNARYGALGVLSEDGEQLEEFIPVGLSEHQLADLAGVALPHGRGLLGHLIHHPEPLRVADIGAHPHAVGFPPGHPPMRTLLGIAVTSRGRVYGNLYLTERADGQPFDDDDQDIVVALAGAAGLAIENARLYRQVRASAEHFQRLLLPQLPDLDPFETAAVYRPAATPDHVGGDWYDALALPDGACGLVIGDVGGHDLKAAAAMAQTRNMLRALLYDRRTPPSAVLAQLDRTLEAITDNPITTVCLMRIEPADTGWTLHWSSAGHPPPLVIPPDGAAHYLQGDRACRSAWTPRCPAPTTSTPSRPAPHSYCSPTAWSNTPPALWTPASLPSPAPPPPTPAPAWTTCAGLWPTPASQTAATTSPSSPCAPRPDRTTPAPPESPSPVDTSARSGGGAGVKPACRDTRSPQRRHAVTPRRADQCSSRACEQCGTRPGCTRASRPAASPVHGSESPRPKDCRAQYGLLTFPHGRPVVPRVRRDRARQLRRRAAVASPAGTAVPPAPAVQAGCARGSPAWLPRGLRQGARRGA